LAIIDALPLEVTRPASSSGFIHEAHNAPSYQISTESDNLRQNYSNLAVSKNLGAGFRDS